jgi:hypothetical protein
MKSFQFSNFFSIPRRRRKQFKNECWSELCNVCLFKRMAGAISPRRGMGRARSATVSFQEMDGVTDTSRSNDATRRMSLGASEQRDVLDLTLEDEASTISRDYHPLQYGFHFPFHYQQSREQFGIVKTTEEWFLETGVQV